MDKESHIHLIEKKINGSNENLRKASKRDLMIVGNMTDSSESLDANPIPQLSELRRAPVRYRHILPLTIMKRYQCIVVGAAKGKLTIAITDSQNMEVIESLSRYTGKTIFPVLIHPKRMQLLLQRIERREQCSGNFHPKRNQAQGIYCYLYNIQRLQISSILMFITSQKTRGS